MLKRTKINFLALDSHEILIWLHIVWGNPLRGSGQENDFQWLVLRFHTEVLRVPRSNTFYCIDGPLLNVRDKSFLLYSATRTRKWGGG